LGFYDTRYLFRSVLKYAANIAVELGTGTGFSTAVVCHALNWASQAGLVATDYQVVTYDISARYYADRCKKVGAAALEQLPSELLEHVIFRNPAVASDVRKDYQVDEVALMFIDANHRHPWPTLDLFATLDCLRAGAVVILHDINLPVIHPQFPHWGVKYLFDDLKVPKDTPHDPEMPNIGRIIIPADKDQLRAELLSILFAHPWEMQVKRDYLKQIGIDMKKHGLIETKRA
jgi:hypothetical protein